MKEDNLNEGFQKADIYGVQPELNGEVNVENQNIPIENVNLESPDLGKIEDDNLSTGNMSMDSNLNKNIGTNNLGVVDTNFNQNVAGDIPNTENVANEQNVNKNIDNGSLNNINQENGQLNNLDNMGTIPNEKKKINPMLIGGIVALAIVVIILVRFLGGSKALNKYVSYLPKDKSEYDAICVKEDKYEGNEAIAMYEVIGMNEIEKRYISYSMAIVLTKKDGSAIEENKNNKSAADEKKENFESSGYLGVSTGFKDGNLVVNYGMSNFTYSKTKDAVKDFEKEGYDCK